MDSAMSVVQMPLCRLEVVVLGLPEMHSRAFSRRIRYELIDHISGRTSLEVNTICAHVLVFARMPTRDFAELRWRMLGLRWNR